ncbi:Uncharacterised protein [BD1-7 clade bacterium]|uniref:Integrase catalytic domain-containing protein n=1 Tax=BD1-7 clade bacterium TaxID=2029982 RepID=A0A5S9PGJ1_9GAMM|nr:Uncharacterised protein [BD1-7 clade bacterium]
MMRCGWRCSDVVSLKTLSYIATVVAIIVLALTKLIEQHKLQQSMSRLGNCWDNACVESFFHSLKVEAIHDEPLMNRRREVFE